MWTMRGDVVELLWDVGGYGTDGLHGWGTGAPLGDFLHEGEGFGYGDLGCDYPSNAAPEHGEGCGGYGASGGSGDGDGILDAGNGDGDDDGCGSSYDEDDFEEGVHDSQRRSPGATRTLRWETVHQLLLCADLARLPAELARQLAHEPAARAVALDLARTHRLRTLVAVLSGT